jgi:hypothetical protein
MLLLDISPQTFNWPTFIITFLGSGSLAAIVTFFTTNRVKKNEFDWEYKKYILEKRKNAYEEIYPMICQVFTSMTDPNGTTWFSILTLSEEEVLRINDEIAGISTFDQWVSDELNGFVFNLSNYLNSLWVRLASSKKINEADPQETKTIQNFEATFKSIYWKDVSEMNQIEKFIRNKK